MPFLLSFLLNLTYALVGFSVLLISSVCLDRRIQRLKGGHFRAVIDRIHEQPLSTAIYYGLRFAGLCILAGSFIRG